jgi:hypothetical protein
VRPELQAIVDEVALLLSASTTLEDRDSNLIAFSAQRDDVDQARRLTILRRRSTPSITDWLARFAIAATDEPLRTPADPVHGVEARLCLPAQWRGATYGYLWALNDSVTPDSPEFVKAVRLANAAGGILAQQRAQRDDDVQTLTDLLSGNDRIAHDAASRMADRGLIGPGQPVAVVVVQRPADAVTSLPIEALPAHIEVATDGATSITVLVGLHESCDLRPAYAAAERTIGLYRASLAPEWSERIVAGISNVRDDIARMGGSWQEARLAARVASSVPAFRPIARWSELGVYRLLAAEFHVDLLDLLIDPAVGQLLDSDDAGLVPTILAYLDHACSVRGAAEVLNVHRQTVYYRIAKAEQLSGLDFARGEHRLRLHLALALAPLLRSSSRPTPRAIPTSVGQLR